MTEPSSPPSSPRSLSPLRFKIFALALSSIFAVIFGEVAVRLLTEFQPPEPFPQVKYDAHPRRLWTLRPNQKGYTLHAPYSTDAHGFRRNGSEGVSDPDRANIFFLGDSFTFGMGVSDEETLPAQLERRLRKQTGRAISVINGGIIGYNIFHLKDLFVEKALPLKPKLVIHGLYWNDFLEPVPPSNPPPAVDDQGYFTWDSMEPPSGIRGLFHGFARVSALLNAVRVAKRNLNRDVDEGVEKYLETFRRFKANGYQPEEYEPLVEFYRWLKDQSQTHGFSLYVVIFPEKVLFGSADLEQHHFLTSVLGALRELKIPTVDGMSLWNARHLGEETIIPGDIHLTGDALAILAEEMTSLLARDPSITAQDRRKANSPPRENVP